MLRSFAAVGAVLIALSLPGVLLAQAAPTLTPLAGHPCSDEVNGKIAALVKGENLVAATALCFSSVTGAADVDGLVVAPAVFSAADAGGLKNGRLLMLLLDPAHLSPENALTVRWVVPEGGDLAKRKMAFSTMKAEGQDTLQAILTPNLDWFSGVVTLPPAVVETLADKLIPAGPLKLGAVVSPGGLQIVIGRTAPGHSTTTYTVPTLADLKAHGAEWSENAAMK